jgi:hypothetical protein
MSPLNVRILSGATLRIRTFSGDIVIAKR